MPGTPLTEEQLLHGINDAMDRMERAQRSGESVPQVRKRNTRGQWGCAVASVAGPATGVLGSVLLAAAWRACDVGVNGAATGLALIFYGAVLAGAAAVWWGLLIGYVGRWNLAVALAGGAVGTAVMIWIFVVLLQVPHGYRC
ncbi:hypothetical protein [Streptomyces sp. NPDC001717]|uniref:hypothetical protein n=1 Tax=Streptomyces sp. NPDC001717 TaxID=3364604 RepID=UPI0036906A7F